MVHFAYGNLKKTRQSLKKKSKRLQIYKKMLSTFVFCTIWSVIELTYEDEKSVF